MSHIGERAAITKLDDWVQGETQTFEWPVYRSDNRTIQDISGFTIEFRMALGKGGPSVLTKAVINVDPTHGLCQVTITPVDTAGLQPLTYWYELWRTDSGFQNRLAHGDAVLLAGVA